jgi:hypothetical protein
MTTVKDYLEVKIGKVSVNCGYQGSSNSGYLYKVRSMNSPEIQQFIKEHSALFWYIPEEKKPEISEELLVETILNYGDMEAVRKLFHLMGIQKVSVIFNNAQGRKK